jgi:AcrR family transcriptional regulator
MVKRRAGVERMQVLGEALIEALLEGGPSSVTREGVAERAQVSQNLVTYHFGSMHGLWAQAQQVAVDRLAESLEGAVHTDGTPAERLAFAARSLAPGERAHGALAAAAMLAALSRVDPNCAAAARHAGARRRSALTSLMRMCGAIAPESASADLDAALLGLGLRALMEDEPMSYEAVDRSLKRVLAQHGMPEVAQALDSYAPPRAPPMAPLPRAPMGTGAKAEPAFASARTRAKQPRR